MSLGGTHDQSEARALVPMRADWLALCPCGFQVSGWVVENISHREGEKKTTKSLTQCPWLACSYLIYKLMSMLMLLLFVVFFLNPHRWPLLIWSFFPKSLFHPSLQNIKYLLISLPLILSFLLSCWSLKIKYPGECGGRFSQLESTFPLEFLLHNTVWLKRNNVYLQTGRGREMVWERMRHSAIGKFYKTSHVLFREEMSWMENGYTTPLFDSRFWLVRQFEFIFSDSSAYIYVLWYVLVSIVTTTSMAYSSCNLSRMIKKLYLTKNAFNHWCDIFWKMFVQYLWKRKSLQC